MNNFNQTIETIRKQQDLEKFRNAAGKGKEIVLFGAGECGHDVYRILRDAGIQISLFCDNHLAGHTDEETGIEIVGPGYLQNDMEKYVLLICVVVTCQDIYEQFMLLGFATDQIFIMKDYFQRPPLGYMEKHLSEYKDVYGVLEDEYSKKVFLAKMRKTYLLEDLSEIVAPMTEQYFDEKVVLTDKEVFIDCGGFDGDTALQFLKRCNGKYSDIVIFEPEQCKKSDIERNLSGYHYKLYQTGVWSKSERLFFDARGTSSSCVSEINSDYTIDVMSLDETVYDRKPTFIKMDIEGSEQEALRGSMRIIKEFHPKLAICVYHKWEDLYKIPVMIKEWNPDYRLYLRQYSEVGSETVLYAL